MSAVQLITVPWVVDSLKAFIGTYVQTQIPDCGPQQNVSVEFCVNPDELPMHPPVGGTCISFGARVTPPADWEVTDIVVDLAHVDRAIFKPVPLKKSPLTDTWLAKDFLDFWRIVSDRYAVTRFNCTTILVYITLKHSRFVHGFEDNQRALSRMFQDSLWTDFEVRVAGESFAVHKAILAVRSQVFAAMFQAEMEEKKSNFMEIIDFEPLVVKAMLEYIYTGCLNSDAELIWDLILISDKYGLTQLKTNCEELLKKQVEEGNLARVLILSDQVSSDALRGKAVGEIVRVGPRFLESDEWKQLEGSNSQLAMQVLKSVWTLVHKDKVT